MGYTIWPDGPMGEALRDVAQERYRQEELKQAGKFLWTCADDQPSARKLAVLAEEFGELSREVVEEIILRDKAGSDLKAKSLRLNMRSELIQIAAVAVAWAESLER